MAKTILNEHNVIMLLLHHIKRLRLIADEPQIVTADIEIWERAIFALRQRCNSTLLFVFDFKAIDGHQTSHKLKAALTSMIADGYVSIVKTQRESWVSADYILRDELNTAAYHIKFVHTTAVHPPIPVTPKNFEIYEDSQRMYKETGELAEQLLPIIDEQVDKLVSTSNVRED